MDFLSHSSISQKSSLAQLGSLALSRLKSKCWLAGHLSRSSRKKSTSDSFQLLAECVQFPVAVGLRSLFLWWLLVGVDLRSNSPPSFSFKASNGGFSPPHASNLSHLPFCGIPNSHQRICSAFKGLSLDWAHWIIQDHLLILVSWLVTLI